MKELGMGNDRYKLVDIDNRHIPHHINISNFFAEMVNYRLCRFGHALHKLLIADIPLVML